LPNGFVAPHPGGNVDVWVVDHVAETVAYDAAGATAEGTQKDWNSAIAATDGAMPRWFEDYVIENSITLAPGRVKDNYMAKVALRAAKP
jgi:hypothetical protein